MVMVFFFPKSDPPEVTSSDSHAHSGHFRVSFVGWSYDVANQSLGEAQSTNLFGGPPFLSIKHPQDNFSLQTAN